MLKLTTIALALALLGCGSSTSSSLGNFSNSSVALDSSARQLTVEVPPGGGTVTLQRTQNIAGTLTNLSELNSPPKSTSPSPSSAPRTRAQA